MKIYTIRLKGTNKYLPARRGRGFSNDEPEVTGNPRVFTSYVSARNALSQWLLGVHKCSRGQDGYEYYEETVIVPQPHRKREHMEIVEYEAREISS